MLCFRRRANSRVHTRTYSPSDIQSEASDSKPIGIDLPQEEGDIIQQTYTFGSDYRGGTTSMNKTLTSRPRPTNLSEALSDIPHKRDTLMSIQNQREAEMQSGRYGNGSFKFEVNKKDSYYEY